MKPTAQEIVRGLIELTEQNGGPELLRDVYRQLGRRLHGDDVAKVIVITPSGNSGAFAETVKSLVEKKTGRTVELSEKADASLIGGAIVQFDDERIDLSLRGSLTELEHSLSASSLNS